MCHFINGLQGDLHQIPRNRKNKIVSVFPHNNNMQPILEVETK